MSAKPPYGVLLVTGGQTHQENYARAFAADSRCRLIGLTDEADIPHRRYALNADLARELEIPLLDDFEAALARDDVHIVSLCCESERRGRLAIQAARAKKHIYLDKPLASNVDDALGVVRAAAENGVRSQVFSMVRTPVVERAFKVIESGRLGDVVGIHCALFFAKGKTGTADLTKPRREKADATKFTFIESKRELECIGVYPLMMLQLLLKARVKSVYATTSNYFFAEHQRHDVEDYACLLIELANGVQGSITVGRTGWMSHPGGGINQIQLIGTKGSATLDAFRPRLEMYCDAPAWQQPNPPHSEDPMGFWSSTQKAAGIKPKTAWQPVDADSQSDTAYFVDCIEANRESDVSAAVGTHALEVILAGYRSAAEHRPVAIA